VGLPRQDEITDMKLEIPRFMDVDFESSPEFAAASDDKATPLL
jgi:hypothetical protein